LATLRIVILLMPLLFHSYTGTALKCIRFYQLLYYGTFVVVSVHIIALLVFNPESVFVFWPDLLVPTFSIHEGMGRSRTLQQTMVDYATASLSYYSVNRFLVVQHLHELRRIWLMLWSTLVSDSCHLIICFWHVRSTAPSSSLVLRGGRYYRTPTVYYAIRSGVGCVDRNNSFINGNSNSNNNNNNVGSSNGSTSTTMAVDVMNVLVNDLHVRLHRAKNEWSKRLDDFSRRLATSNSMTSNTGSSIPDPLLLSPSNGHYERLNSGLNNGITSSAQAQQSQLYRSTMTPFRVLLHLFAYEDVLENGKLDAVFEQDDGVALTFFIPQLLSFLFHGALWCSPQLELWILSKCQKNVRFPML
jgi:hypothetical protein